MLSNIFKWLENLWNLRKIFDKYLPQIRELLETVKKLQQQIADLKAMKEDLENGILLLKSTTKDDKQDTTVEMEIPSSTPRKSIVNSYYDSEGNGGWDVIINPDSK